MSRYISHRMSGSLAVILDTALAGYMVLEQLPPVLEHIAVLWEHKTGMKDSGYKLA